jgi:hypothetical protein
MYSNASRDVYLVSPQRLALTGAFLAALKSRANLMSS